MCRPPVNRPCRAESLSLLCDFGPSKRCASTARSFKVDSNRILNGRVGAMKAAFLPVTREEMLERGWDRVDFVYVSGDAYVDHPSFGMAIITRLLEANGYKVGVIAQPDWNDPESVAVFGEPRLAFLVSAGNMDSMVNHYTVAKKRRRSDAYSPGGEAGPASEPRCRGVRQPDQAHVQEDSAHSGRHRGQPAAAFALRLLVGQAEALHPAGFGGPDLVSYGMGGAFHHRDRRRVERGAGHRGTSRSSTARCTAPRRSSTCTTR